MTLGSKLSMTGYTVHTGSTVKFSTGWDNIFGTSRKKASADQEKQRGGESKATKTPKKKTSQKKTSQKKTQHKKTPHTTR